MPRITDRAGKEVSSTTPTFHLGSNLSLVCSSVGGSKALSICVIDAGQSCSHFLGIPRPSLEWWIRDEQGEKLLLHTDRSDSSSKESRSFLDYGPLQRGHHNNQVTCEAKNNEKIAPLANALQIQMICM